MKINPRKPFDVFKGNEQELIKNSFPKKRYEILQNILRYLSGETTKDQLPDELKNKEDNQIKDYYSYHFTVLFGDLLCQIGANFQTTNPTIQFDFDKLKNSNHNPAGNNLPDLSNQQKIQRLMLDNQREYITFDNPFPTPNGNITAVSILYFEYSDNEEGEYGELDDNLFQDLYYAIQMQIEANEKTFQKSQGL